jgi:adenylate kinase
MTRMLIIGPPGSGKGTQAERISERLGVVAISTGDIFRANVKGETPLGVEAKKYMDAGDFVPDSVTNKMVRDRLGENDVEDGFLLDGYPRTIAQADALDEALDESGRRLTAALYIDADDETVIQRLSGRRQCKNGHLYHVEFNPPKLEGMCELDNTRLYQREDDKPDKIRKRLDTYHRETEPLIDYYEQRGLLRRFDGSRSPTEVHDHIRATLATLRLEERL